MRSRLPLFLNELTLEDILFLEDELSRRKEKHRRHYSVLVVQTDKAILRADNLNELVRFTRDARRYISGSSAVGGGAILAFSPEVSAALFTSVAKAASAASALLTALPELNGRYEQLSLRFGVKMGLATGVDTLSPGSPRSVRGSTLVARANRLAKRSATNALLMDQNSHNEWYDKQSAIITTFDADGETVYRVIPGLFRKEDARYDNESLVAYLKRVAGDELPTLKYSVERVARNVLEANPNLSGHVVQISLEAYNLTSNQNMTFKEIVPAADYAPRMDVVKRIVNSMGLAMVRYDMDATGGA